MVGDLYQMGHKDVPMEGPGDYTGVLMGAPGEDKDFQQVAPDKYMGMLREAPG